MFDSSTFKKALNLYAGPHVHDRLVKAKDAALQPWHDRIDAVVYVQDVTGFVTLSEHFGPEDLLAMMNQYLDESAAGISESGGVVSDFQGDSVVAYWHASVDAVDRACDAAVRNLQISARLRIPMILQVGITSGQVFLANMGGKHHLKLQIVGDVFNLASRLSGANRLYGTEVMLNESAAILANRHKLRELDRVRVKGKQDPMAIFQLMDQA